MPVDASRQEARERGSNKAGPNRGWLANDRGGSAHLTVNAAVGPTSAPRSIEVGPIVRGSAPGPESRACARTQQFFSKRYEPNVSPYVLLHQARGSCTLPVVRRPPLTARPLPGRVAFSRRRQRRLRRRR